MQGEQNVSLLEKEKKKKKGEDTYFGWNVSPRHTARTQNNFLTNKHKLFYWLLKKAKRKKPKSFLSNCQYPLKSSVNSN